MLGKSFGPDIETVGRQRSGNEERVIGGIGVVSERFWVIDYRILDPEGDGSKSKLDHVEGMVRSLKHRRVAFGTVLMDSWYATTKEMMLLVDGMGKAFYCPPKSDRQVDGSGGESNLIDG